MINFFSKFKIFFYLFNLILFLLYLFPGSLLGCIFFDDCKVQPQITKDYIISSNHFYIFGLITFLGYLTYFHSKKLRIIIIYLISIAIVLEVLHFTIPERSFQFPDLFGNLAGILFVIIINTIIKNYEIFKK